MTQKTTFSSFLLEKEELLFRVENLLYFLMTATDNEIIREEQNRALNFQHLLTKEEAEAIRKLDVKKLWELMEKLTAEISGVKSAFLFSEKDGWKIVGGKALKERDKVILRKSEYPYEKLGIFVVEEIKPVEIEELDDLKIGAGEFYYVHLRKEVEA